MIIARFLVKYKLEKVQFFEKIVLIANTNIEMILKILFLTFFYSNIRFVENKLK